MISQEQKLGYISYFVCRCNTLSTRSLILFFSGGHLGSRGVSNCENLVNWICQDGNFQVYYADVKGLKSLSVEHYRSVAVIVNILFVISQ